MSLKINPPTLNSTANVGTLANGNVLGVFRGSYDKQLHIAEYVPYSWPPHAVLCGGRAGHLTATGGTHKPLCVGCEYIATRLLEVV